MTFDEFDKLYTELYEQYLVPLEEVPGDSEPFICGCTYRTMKDLVAAERERSSFVPEFAKERHFGGGNIVAMFLDQKMFLAIIHKTATRDDVKAVLAYLADVEL